MNMVLYFLLFYYYYLLSAIDCNSPIAVNVLWPLNEVRLSCQETIEPMKANSAKFATKTELNERHGHFEETLSVNKGQIIEVEQRVSQLEKGNGSGGRNLSGIHSLCALKVNVGACNIVMIYQLNCMCFDLLLINI